MSEVSEVQRVNLYGCVNGELAMLEEAKMNFKLSPKRVCVMNDERGA